METLRWLCEFLGNNRIENAYIHKFGVDLIKKMRKNHFRWYERAQKKPIEVLVSGARREGGRERLHKALLGTIKEICPSLV